MSLCLACNVADLYEKLSMWYFLSDILFKNIHKMFSIVTPRLSIYGNIILKNVLPKIFQHCYMLFMQNSMAVQYCYDRVKPTLTLGRT